MLVAAPNSRHAFALIVIAFLTLCTTSRAGAELPDVFTPPGRLVLIIDDLGNNLPLGLRAIALGGAITYGILPFSPGTTRLAEAAAAAGKEVILHLPMSNIYDKPLGPGALTAALERHDFYATVEKALASVPHIRGVNNHMGSHLTGLPQQMEWLMDVLKCHRLYFIDSRTTAQTVAATAAGAAAIPHLSRDVFLDHTPTPAAIDRSFQRAVALAKRNGLAVMIAHPYPVTLDYLERALPALPLSGVTLLPASHAITTMDAVPRTHTQLGAMQAFHY